MYDKQLLFVVNVPIVHPWNEFINPWWRSAFYYLHYHQYSVGYLIWFSFLKYSPNFEPLLKADFLALNITNPLFVKVSATHNIIRMFAWEGITQSFNDASVVLPILSLQRQMPFYECWLGFGYSLPSPNFLMIVALRKNLVVTFWTLFFNICENSCLGAVLG